MFEEGEDEKCVEIVLLYSMPPPSLRPSLARTQASESRSQRPRGPLVVRVLLSEDPFYTSLEAAHEAVPSKARYGPFQRNEAVTDVCTIRAWPPVPLEKVESVQGTLLEDHPGDRMTAAQGRVQQIVPHTPAKPLVERKNEPDEDYRWWSQEDLREVINSNESPFSAWAGWTSANNSEARRQQFRETVDILVRFASLLDSVPFSPHSLVVGAQPSPSSGVQNEGEKKRGSITRRISQMFTGTGSRTRSKSVGRTSTRTRTASPTPGVANLKSPQLDDPTTPQPTVSRQPWSLSQSRSRSRADGHEPRLPRVVGGLSANFDQLFFD